MTRPPTSGRPSRAAPRPPARRPAKATPSKAKSGRGSGSGRGRRPAARRPGGPLVRLARWIMRLVWGIGWRVGLVTALILGGYVLIAYPTLPPVSEILDGRTRGSVTLLDRSGEVFAWRGDQFGGGIRPETASPYLMHAIVATEDRRFYLHPGVDPIGILGAMRINLSEGRSALSGHGGSTITQQTAKLLCVGQPYDPASGRTEAQYESDCRAGTLARKGREALYAVAMEARYTKDEILTIYMNRAYLGAGTRGFEAASQRYFDKSASDVTPAEAAMLAGLLKAPSLYAPTANLQRSRDRANIIIGLMEEQGYITRAQADEARAHPAELSPAAASRTGSYFADWVMTEMPSWWGRGTTEDVVLRTTLDRDLQIATEEAVAAVFASKVSAGSKAEAAVVVMSPDGAVRAMVGGREPGDPGSFNRAVQAKRQTGSSFKPFVYATALDMGYSYRDTVQDAPLTINVPGSGAWSPKNYSRDFKGTVTMTEALKDSLNTAVVRVSEAVGPDNVRRVARAFGIDSDLAVGPSYALGVSEATLLETTSAYAGFLNGGRAVKPFGVTSLRLFGERTPAVEETGGVGEQVISEEAARQLVYMLYQVVEAGTGHRAKLPGRQAAGKTGTTQAARDAWFIGFTGDYVTGVWMGYDDNTPLRGTTGGGLPAEIWHEVMVRVEDGLPPKPLPMITPSDPGVRVATGPVEDMEGDGSDLSDPAPPRPQAPRASGGSNGGPNLADRIQQGFRRLFGGN